MWEVVNMQFFPCILFGDLQDYIFLVIIWLVWGLLIRIIGLYKAVKKSCLFKSYVNTDFCVSVCRVSASCKSVLTYNDDRRLIIFVYI